MTEPPPRTRFQIHLSTVLLLLCVTGALLWANLCQSSMKPHDNWEFDGRLEPTVSQIRSYGWPFTACRYLELHNTTIIPARPYGSEVAGWSGLPVSPGLMT